MSQQSDHGPPTQQSRTRKPLGQIDAQRGNIASANGRAGHTSDHIGDATPVISATSTKRVQGKRGNGSNRTKPSSKDTPQSMQSVASKVSSQTPTSSQDDPFLIVHESTPTTPTTAMASMVEKPSFESPTKHKGSDVGGSHKFVSPLAQRRAQMRQTGEKGSDALSEYQFRVLIDEVDFGDGEDTSRVPALSTEVESKGVGVDPTILNSIKAIDSMDHAANDAEVVEQSEPGLAAPQGTHPKSHQNQRKNTTKASRGHLNELRSKRREEIATQNEDSVEDYRQTNRQLAMALTKLQVHAKELAKRNLSLEQLLTRKVSDIRDIRETIMAAGVEREQALMNERDELQASLDKAQDRIARVESTLREIERMVNERKTQDAAKIQTLTEEKQELERMLNDVREELRITQSKNAEIQTGSDRLRQELSEVRDEQNRERLVSRGLWNANQALESALLSARKQITHLRQTLSELALQEVSPTTCESQSLVSPSNDIVNDDIDVSEIDLTAQAPHSQTQ